VLGVLDSTISNVALPTMAQDLNVSSATVVWVVNAFQLATTMFIVPLASSGDIVGFARIFRTGTIVFVVASVFCATAHTFGVLVAARTVQGIGAAAILASSQPIARFTYPAAQLGLAIGIQSLIVSTSSAAGPSIGGLILAIGSWPWLFWINVPFGLLALALSGLLPELPRSTHRFDWPSAVLSGSTLALFITGLDQLRAPANVTLFGLELSAALILGTIVVRRQRSLDPPFLALDLLKSRIIRLSLLASIAGFIAQNVALVALPFYLRALGYGAAETGFLMTPFPAGTALIALVSGRLADRYHAGVLGAIGLVLFGGGMALLALLPDHAAPFDIVWRTTLSGAGFGLFASPNLRAMVGAAPRHRSGAITGLTTTSRMSGSTTGVALAALLFSAAAGSAGTSPMRAALWLAVAFAIAGLVISTLRIGPLNDPG
jgi:DHA2 family multidrug resistance protein-like MFS transporter